MGSIKDTARALRSRSHAAVRRVLLRGGLRSLQRQLAQGGAPDDALLSRLVQSWANEAWSTDTALLGGLLQWLPRSRGPIVECGSGLSTLVMACAAHAAGRKVYALEHHASWANRVESRLPPKLRPHAEVIVAPLASFDAFDWYGVDPARTPPSVGFVLCDGPPGTTRGGRYGLLPRMRARLSPDCIIVLDDTQREEESRIVDAWCTEFGVVVLDRRESYTVMGMRKQ